MRALARAMLDEAITGKQGPPADLVVVLDDVELANLGQESIVIEHFRAAVNVELSAKASSQATRDRYNLIVRQKCSYHLLRPMVEAYLFGDVAALANAGVSVAVAPLLLHPTDVEAFEAVDSLWTPDCVLRNQNQTRNGRPWWRHEKHPKCYLEHLIGRSNNNTYDETVQGALALQNLAWGSVPKVPADVSFVRALFEDLADWFGTPNPIPGQKSALFYPPMAVNRANLLLRNL